MSKKSDSETRFGYVKPWEQSNRDKMYNVIASEGKTWFWFLLPALFLSLRSHQPHQGLSLFWATQRCHHEVKGRGRMKLLGGQVPPWSPQGWAPIIKIIIFYTILLKFLSTPTFFPLNSGEGNEKSKQAAKAGWITMMWLSAIRNCEKEPLS